MYGVYKPPLFDGPFVHLQIPECGPVPAEVPRHGFFLYASKPFFVFIYPQCVAYGIQHIVRVNILKGKAVPFSREFVIGDDRILQASGFPNDGQASVSHGDHLP